MDSEDDDGFPKQGGEALEIGDDFDSEEEQDDGADEEEDIKRRPMMNAKTGNVLKVTDKAAPGGAKENVKGQKVDNQPFDLAVDVNDSEEIESDEEEDEVNVDVNLKHPQAPQNKPP